MPQLRQIWQTLWEQDAHRFLSRPMLEKSIKFRQAELSGIWLTPEQKSRLEQLIKQYKRNPVSFNQKENGLLPGSRIIKTHKGHKHLINVKHDGLLEYQGKTYSSLSQIAYIITGTKWNGWLFFGLKKKKNTK